MKKPVDVKFTKEGFEKLKKEYQDLLEKRPGVLDRLVAAREQGDLSENAGYHASREELSQIDRRLREINILVRHGEVVESRVSDQVGVGGTVKVTDGTNFYEYKIVGALEADPLCGKLSEVSPIGCALIGKKVGDQVEIEIPDGKIVYKIIEIK